MSDEKKIMDVPSSEQLGSELKRLRRKQSFRRNIRSTVGALIVVAAVAIIITSVLLPVFRVTGSSMSPTLANDEVVLCVRSSHYEQGDIVAFHYNNKVLLKRVIGLPGDVIQISEDGTVTVNDVVLNRLFVMGDHRAVSIDSRSTSVGCIAEENVVGVVLMRLLPMKEFGFV